MSGMLSMERRRDVRVRTNLPVEFAYGRGRTYDLSVGGVSFETTVRLEAGAPIRYSLLLTGEKARQHERMECFGTVVRVTPLGDSWRIAATIDNCWFEDGGQMRERGGSN